MAFPQRLLGDGEEVVHDLHPHGKTLVPAALAFVLVVGLMSFGLAALPSGRAHGVAVLVLLAVAAVLLTAFCLVPVLRWRTTRFVLTTRRVIVRTGILGRTGRDVPLHRINDVSYQHSLLERIVGCGTLTVESAGERGRLVLTDLPDIEGIHRELYRLMEAADARRFTAADRDADGPVDR